MKKKTIVFDLDDTLVKEIDYLKSAFAEIARQVDPRQAGLFEEMVAWYQNKEDVFGKLEQRTGKVLKPELKNTYRNHFPNYNPKSENRELLHALKNDGHILGLVTDGFSVTQRNKIKALDIADVFDLIVISEEFGSEKPSERNFSVFHDFGTKEYFYVSDNVSKDFITPNRLGWTTICLLDDGKNIHPQDFAKSEEYLPKYKIANLHEIKNIITE